MVRRQVGDGLRQHHRRRRDRRRLVGYGEVCPLGPFYLPAYADGVRAGIARAGAAPARRRPACSSANSTAAWTPPSRGMPTSSRASTWLAGTSSAKSAGHARVRPAGRPLRRRFRLYRAISQESPEAMAGKVAGYRAEGYRRFQLKVGGDPDVDIERDPRRRRQAPAGRPPGRRRQHRLADARGHAGRPRACATWMSTSSSRA